MDDGILPSKGLSISDRLLCDLAVASSIPDDGGKYDIEPFTSAISANYYDSFDFEFENFWTNANYYCVLAGMGIYPEHFPPLLLHQSNSINKAELIFDDIKRQVFTLSQKLPSTYEFLTGKLEPSLSVLAN